jgi:hypothetical protein
MAKRLKKYQIKYQKYNEQTVLEFVTHAYTPLSGIKDWKDAGLKQEHTIVEIYEDNVLIEIPVDNRKSTKTKGINQTFVKYYCDNDLIDEMKAIVARKKIKVNRFINEAVREKINKET